MEEKQFKQFLNLLRSMEIEDRGRVDIMHFENMDLTEEQKKIISDEFGKKHHSVPRLAKTDFDDNGF